MNIFNLNQEADDQDSIDDLRRELDEWKLAALCCMSTVVSTPENGYRGDDGLANFRSDFHRMYREYGAMRTMLQKFAHKNEWFMHPNGSRRWQSDATFSDAEVRELCKLAGTEVPPEVGT